MRRAWESGVGALRRGRGAGGGAGGGAERVTAVRSRARGTPRRLKLTKEVHGAVSAKRKRQPAAERGGERAAGREEAWWPRGCGPRGGSVKTEKGSAGGDPCGAEYRGFGTAVRSARLRREGGRGSSRARASGREAEEGRGATRAAGARAPARRGNRRARRDAQKSAGGTPRDAEGQVAGRLEVGWGPSRAPAEPWSRPGSDLGPSVPARRHLGSRCRALCAGSPTWTGS